MRKTSFLITLICAMTCTGTLFGMQQENCLNLALWKRLNAEAHCTPGKPNVQFNPFPFYTVIIDHLDETNRLKIIAHKELGSELLKRVNDFCNPISYRDLGQKGVVERFMLKRPFVDFYNKALNLIFFINTWAPAETAPRTPTQRQPPQESLWKSPSKGHKVDIDAAFSPVPPRNPLVERKPNRSFTVVGSDT